MPQQTEKPIPPQGSLALLALGAQGIRAWRIARAQQESAQAPQRKPHG